MFGTNSIFNAAMENNSIMSPGSLIRSKYDEAVLRLIVSQNAFLHVLILDGESTIIEFCSIKNYVWKKSVWDIIL